MTGDSSASSQDNRDQAAASNREPTQPSSALPDRSRLGLQSRLADAQVQAWLQGGIDLAESRRRCREIAKSSYENFLVATVFLPRRLRQPFYNVYAFCRTADDLADRSASTDAALAGLKRYAQQLERIERGEPVDGIFVALAETIKRFQLQRRPFDDLLSAFEQDQQAHRYETLDDLLDYCRRSADPVGRIVLGLADSFNDDNASLSDQICTGLQLANFWQDIARDFRDGRIYLPADRMRHFGVDEGMLSADTTAGPLKSLVRQQCQIAEDHFHRGLPLADRVPRWLRKDILLFAHGGLETIQAIRDLDFDVLRVRPTVGKRRQAILMVRALLGRL